MIRKLFIIFVLLFLLAACRDPSVQLWGPIPFMQKQIASIYKPVDIPFFSIIMVKDGPRKADFRRDSCIVSAFVPAGFQVQSIGVTVLYKNLDSLTKKFANDSMGRYLDSLQKASKQPEAEFQDSMLNVIFLRLIPDLQDMERAPEYDQFLSSVLDTGHTQRQFQSYKCRLPVVIPASLKKPEVTILGRMRLIPTVPGTFYSGMFMSLDNMSAWKAMQDTANDTVLTAFADGDTITVTGTGITLSTEDPGQTNPLLLTALPNPMSVQGGVISFLMQGPSAQVSMYDISGRPIFTEPVKGQAGIRNYLISHFMRRPLNAGQYFIRITADGKTATKPITVLK